MGTPYSGPKGQLPKVLYDYLVYLLRSRMGLTIPAIRMFMGYIDPETYISEAIVRKIIKDETRRIEQGGQAPTVRPGTEWFNQIVFILRHRGNIQFTEIRALMYSLDPATNANYAKIIRIYIKQCKLRDRNPLKGLLGHAFTRKKRPTKPSQQRRRSEN